MTKRAIELKGSLFTLTVLYLNSTHLPDIEEELRAKISQAPDFFTQIPLVIDLAKLQTDSPHDLDLSQLKALLIQYKLVPVALRNVPSHYEALISDTGWAILNEAKKSTKATQIETSHETEETAAEASPKPASASSSETETTTDTATTHSTTKLITQPVRSGQQVYVQGDVVLTNTINAGSEVLADGNIHTYGITRGRILAGVKGNTQARIFCQNLAAEMISIAGFYKVIESIDDALKNQPVQIYLEGEHLKIEKL